MAKPKRLGSVRTARIAQPTIGVFATCDPRIDDASRARAANIVKMTAGVIAERVKTPDNKAVEVVYASTLVDAEAQADIVARQFIEAGVDAVVCAPDTWAFPQLGLISLMSHMPAGTPINITCGNSGPKPGVVFCHAANGALAQSGKLAHINVGNWPDEGAAPEMSDATAEALVDWCYAAVTAAGLRGRRVVVFGHDSMGMETALAHVPATRRTFGLEITRLDMKLLADMLAKKAYDGNELRSLRAWLKEMIGDRVQIRRQADEQRLQQSLAMYLIVRDIMAELNAVGGGFMSQLEWGSDARGLPLPVADVMESLFNSTFDHNGRKPALPYATEADVQGLLTQVFFTWLSGGQPPLFMDFRKVWEPWEIQKLAKAKRVAFTGEELWARRGLVDGDNSGSASFDWAARPGSSVKTIMSGVTMPIADKDYFPGGGNSVSFVSPGGIEGLAGRLAYSDLTAMFSLVWDQAQTVELPERLAKAVTHTSNWNWPHTFVVPHYASMVEYKQYAPANHLHMTWDLSPARVQYWMDLVNVLSVTPWAARPRFVEGVDRPQPLIHLINGGEDATKRILAGRG